MLAEVEAESDASSDHGQAEVIDSASRTAYARRAYVHLMNLRQRQTPATWDTTTGLLISADLMAHKVSGALTMFSAWVNFWKPRLGNTHQTLLGLHRLLHESY